eukprot:1338566-Amorphochlora_amoeboformis.AAC.1
MLFIPIGYSHPDLQRMDEVKGGSPYGAGCLAGPDGSRQPSKLELGIAEHQVCAERKWLSSCTNT